MEDRVQKVAGGVANDFSFSTAYMWNEEYSDYNISYCWYSKHEVYV
jgi:hypothetical protein